MSEKVKQLAETLDKLDPKAAGMIGEALLRALGITLPVVPAVVQAPVVQAPVVEEQTEFTVMLTGFEAAKKIAVIRDVRTLTSLGLIEAKKLVESFPQPLAEYVSKAKAEEIKDMIVKAGGTVEIK